MALDLDCFPSDHTKTCEEQRGSLACSVFELKNLYQERRPYTLSQQLQGLCIKWEDTFIALCRYAMSTDCMEDMTAAEKEVWRYLTYFEDGHTTSASTEHCNGKAVGATDYISIEDNQGELHTGAFPLTLEDESWGFYRTWDGTDSNGEDIWSWHIMKKRPLVPQYCFDERALEPDFDVPKSYVYDSLDEVFYNIHECLPYNDCECDEYELMINDCNDVNNPIGPEDIYKTGCGSDYQNCQIAIEQRNSRRRR